MLHPHGLEIAEMPVKRAPVYRAGAGDTIDSDEDVLAADLHCSAGGQGRRVGPVSGGAGLW